VRFTGSLYLRLRTVLLLAGLVVCCGFAVLSVMGLIGTTTEGCARIIGDVPGLGAHLTDLAHTGEVIYLRHTPYPSVTYFVSGRTTRQSLDCFCRAKELDVWEGSASATVASEIEAAGGDASRFVTDFPEGHVFAFGGLDRAYVVSIWYRPADGGFLLEAYRSRQ
jgi:hypothetical protein